MRSNLESDEAGADLPADLREVGAVDVNIALAAGAFLRGLNGAA